MSTHQATHQHAADHSLVQVARIEPGCFVVPPMLGCRGMAPFNCAAENASERLTHSEGLSTGWFRDHGQTAYSFHKAAASSHAIVPYGCWFFRSSTSGVFANVLRSLRVRTRCEVNVALGIPMPWSADNASHRRQMTSPNATDAAGRNEFCDAEPPIDKLWCTFAMKRGFDSIQIAGPRPGQKGEVVLCYGGCVRQREDSACPAVPLYSSAHSDSEKNASAMWSSYGRADTCACTDRSSVLNCGGLVANDTSSLQRHVHEHRPTLLLPPAISLVGHHYACHAAAQFLLDQ